MGIFNNNQQRGSSNVGYKNTILADLPDALDDLVSQRHITNEEADVIESRSREWIDNAVGRFSALGGRLSTDDLYNGLKELIVEMASKVSDGRRGSRGFGSAGGRGGINNAYDDSPANGGLRGGLRKPKRGLRRAGEELNNAQPAVEPEPVVPPVPEIPFEEPKLEPKSHHNQLVEQPVTIDKPFVIPPKS